MTLAITRKNLTYFISPPRYVEPKFFSFSLSCYIYKPSYCRSCLVGRLSRYRGSMVANFSTLAKKLLDATPSALVKVTLNDLRSDPLSSYLCKPPMRFANEYMSDHEFNHKVLETLRLPSFLLKSGFSSFEPGQKNLIVNYFFDRSPHFLTTAYNKAINGFYDHYLDRSADLPPLEQRTTDLFFTAAKRLLAIHGLSKRVSDETLKDLLILKGPLEKYLNEKLIIPTKL